MCHCSLLFLETEFIYHDQNEIGGVTISNLLILLLLILFCKCSDNERIMILCLSEENLLDYEV